MALIRSYVVTPGALAQLFKKISEGQAPPKFTIQYLKDIGFKSGNHRPFIPLLKNLGFLTGEGVPTQRYHDFRGGANSRGIMGEALREAYEDLFLIKANPTDSDRPILLSKFKSTHNVSDELAERMYQTFSSLLRLADLSHGSAKSEVGISSKNSELPREDSEAKVSRSAKASLHYNIQIHLPATKDIEVYNSIFKSLKDHLID